MEANPSSQTVVVLGASPKSDRYAYRALEMLKKHGHRAIPVNPAFDNILGEKCYPTISAVPKPIDTVTLYLREARSTPLIEEILAASPRRIIMNPGAENAALAVEAEKVGIEVVEDCTLVMLRAGQF
jgi:predicted CoA-binding protein